MKEIIIKNRKIGFKYSPFVIAEVGINHEGDMRKAKKMILDAVKAGAECVKFQHHVIEDEMAPAAKKVVPGNADVSIWEIMERCALTKADHEELKKYCEELGIIYLCTPFSRAAANELRELNVNAYKIGSGECNNYPLIGHIASFGKPIILSTGMNNIESISKSVEIIKKAGAPYALLHCVSMYPAPYNKVHLNALKQMMEKFDVPVGLSDHSLGIYTCLGAVALGASILEKHFTSDKSWPGPDVSISIDPAELKELIVGSKAIKEALEGNKEILAEEQPTINFAYASVVSIKNIKKGEKFTKDNLWVKRPGIGILAEKFFGILGKTAAENIGKDELLKESDIQEKI